MMRVSTKIGNRGEGCYAGCERARGETRVGGKNVTWSFVHTIEVSPGKKRLEKMESNPNPLASFGILHCIIASEDTGTLNYGRDL